MQMTHETVWLSGPVWSLALLPHPQPSGRPLPLPSHLQPQVHAPPYHSLLSFQLACLKGPTETALQVDGELLPNTKMRLLGASYYILVDSVQIPWFSTSHRTSVILSFPPSLSSTWHEGNISYLLKPLTRYQNGILCSSTTGSNSGSW